MRDFTEMGSFLVACAFLSIALWTPVSSSKPTTPQEYEVALKKLSEIENWSLRGMGESSSTLVKIFIVSPVRTTIDKAIRGAFKNKFLKNAFSSTLIIQIPFTIALVIGFLLALLLLFLPFFITFYGSRHSKTSFDHREPMGRKEWVLFALFLICCILAFAFTIVLIISSIRAYFTLIVPFKYATFSVAAIYDLRLMLQRNFQNNLRSLIHTAFDSSMFLYNINGLVGSQFMKKMELMFLPVLNFAGTMNYQFFHNSEILDHHRNHLDRIIDEASNVSNDQSSRFLTAVDKIKQLYSSESESLDPLLKNFPAFNVSRDAGKALLKPIEALRNASKGNLQSGFLEVYYELQMVATDNHYDPSDLMLRMRQGIFAVEKKLRPRFEEYVAFVEGSFLTEDYVTVNKRIESVQLDFQRSALVVFVLVLIFSSFSIFFIIAISVLHTVAVVKTERHDPLGGKNFAEPVRGATWPWRSLLFICYATSGFLSLFWTLKMFLFLFTSLSVQICMSVQDKSLMDVTFDDNSFRDRPRWYSMFTSKEFNMTLKNSINDCKRNASYITFIPRRIVSKRDSDAVLKDLNLTSTVKAFDKAIKNITAFNVSVNAISNYSNVFDGVNLHPPFQDMQVILSKMRQLDAPKVLTNIKKKANAEKISNLVDIALDSHELMRTDLQNRVGLEAHFNKSIETIRLSLLSVKKELGDLVWVSSALHDYILKESAELYEAILNKTIKEVVEAVFFEMKLGTVDFSKSMSFCQHLNIFYDKGSVIFCNVVLYPISNCWFSALFVCVFMLIAVWLSVLRVPFELPSDTGYVGSADSSTKTSPQMSSGSDEDRKSAGKPSVRITTPDSDPENRRRKQSEDEGRMKKQKVDPTTLLSSDEDMPATFIRPSPRDRKGSFFAPFRKTQYKPPK